MMLPGVRFSPLHEFSINIGRIRNGWMDITLSGNEKQYKYIAGYSTNPLEDLLRMMVKGITKKPYYEENGLLMGNQCIVLHDTEGNSLFTWAFHFDEDNMHITIWEDVDDDLLEGLYDVRFDPNSIEYYDFVHDVDVDKHLLFAIEGRLTDFARLLKTVLEELAARERIVDEFKDWGYRFSVEHFRILSESVEGEVIG